jgi:phosphatidylinositol alpha-1,6-mannosyltransferase
MTRKRILSPAYDFKPLLGGVANYGHELAVQFSRRAEVHVLTRRLEGMEAFDRDLPYRITRIPAPYSGLFSFPLFARAVGRLMRESPYDAVFCPMWFPDGAAARWGRGRAAVPFAVAAHGTEVFDNYAGARNAVKSALLRGEKRRVLREAARIFPVSHYTRRAVVQEGADPLKAVTVHNGVNLGVYHRAPVDPQLRARYRPNGERLLLTVTRLHPYKGVDRMLDALPAVAQAAPDVRYVVVGVGPDLARLQALAAERGVADRVRFTGRLDLEEIVALYNMADLFLLLSREEPPDVEGFGLVFLEAAACGLPSVGGRSGGIPDAIDEGKTGWLVNPTDSAEIATTVTNVLCRPELLRAASERCLAAAPEASWERAAARILNELSIR